MIETVSPYAKAALSTTASADSTGSSTPTTDGSYNWYVSFMSLIGSQPAFTVIVFVRTSEDFTSIL